MSENNDAFVNDSPSFDKQDDNPDGENENAEPPKPPKKKATRQIPQYLRILMSMAGMDADDLNVDMSTAWVRVESTGLITNVPVPFLAPEALETLEAKGHSGHTTFEFSRNSGEGLIAYMATQLREPENNPDDETTWNADVPEQIQNTFIVQEQKISQLTAMINKLSEDPLKPLEVAFTLMDRLAEFNEKVMSRIPQGATGGGLDVQKIVDTIATVTEVVKGSVGTPQGDPNGKMDGDLNDGE